MGLLVSQREGAGTAFRSGVREAPESVAGTAQRGKGRRRARLLCPGPPLSTEGRADAAAGQGQSGPGHGVDSGAGVQGRR